MSTNFADILNKKPTEIERPKPLPIGTYIAMLPAPGEVKEIGKNNTPAIEYKARILAPGPDVDMAALNDAGGCSGKELRLTFWLSEDALFRFKEFLLNHVGLEEGDKSIGQLAAEAVNRQFSITVGHRPSQDGSAIYAEIKGTAKA